MNHYETLRVPTDASPETIKTAYDMALAAYVELANVESRKAYDAKLQIEPKKKQYKASQVPGI